MEHLRRLGHGAGIVSVVIVLVLSVAWLWDWAARQPCWVGYAVATMFLAGMAYLLGYQFLSS